MIYFRNSVILTFVCFILSGCGAKLSNEEAKQQIENKIIKNHYVGFRLEYIGDPMVFGCNYCADGKIEGANFFRNDTLGDFNLKINGQNYKVPSMSSSIFNKLLLNGSVKYKFFRNTCSNDHYSQSEPCGSLSTIGEPAEYELDFSSLKSHIVYEGLMKSKTDTGHDFYAITIQTDKLSNIEIVGIGEPSDLDGNKVVKVRYKMSWNKTPVSALLVYDNTEKPLYCKNGPGSFSPFKPDSSNCLQGDSEIHEAIFEKFDSKFELKHL